MGLFVIDARDIPLTRRRTLRHCLVGENIPARHRNVRRTPVRAPTPLRGPIRKAISGYRFYNPELGRWLNRDPIEEWGGLNLYSFAMNTSTDLWDFLGLACSCSDSGGTGNRSHCCCGSEFYDPKTSCCVDRNVHSRNEKTKMSGLKKYCVYKLFGLLPEHCWLEWDGGSAGFYMNFDLEPHETPFPYFVRGMVQKPETGWVNIPRKKLVEEFLVSECVDLDELKACVDYISSMHYHQIWLPPVYNWGVRDCRHYPKLLVTGCEDAINNCDWKNGEFISRIRRE